MLHLDPEHFNLKPHFATIHCEPGWQWRRRDLPMPNYDLFYVWSGEGDLILNGRHFHLRPQSCFLFRPGDEITATHQPQNPLVLTYIHFDMTASVTLIPQPYRIIKDFISLESLLRRYVRLFLVHTFGAEIEAKLILKQMMIHLLREEQVGEEKTAKASYSLLETIEEIANYVQQHPGDPHTVESLAARASLSPKYFSQKFREIIGQTVRSYIVHARIKRAEHLLHFTGMTVTEAADALGYNDVHFFSRQFKHYTGKKPSEIR
ncbi:helix-turn-helix domain-containing protein [Paenibacillus sp. GCM10027626]|uniref:helix-turn-helix domain-containing protein n=1 Tax=Paenibacillus sp. GCM10027626 TaxID=3273411 RepID=UPI00362C596C